MFLSLRLSFVSLTLSLSVCESLSHTLRSLLSLPGSFFHRFCAPNWLPRAVHLTVELGEQRGGSNVRGKHASKRSSSSKGRTRKRSDGGRRRQQQKQSNRQYCTLCMCVWMRRFSFLSPFCQLWTKQKKLQWQKSGLMDGWKHYSDKVQRSHESLTLTKVQRSHGKMKNLLWQSPAFSWIDESFTLTKSPAVPWMDENIILTNEWSQNRMKFLLWFVDGWIDGCVLLQQLASYLAGPLIIIIINYWIFQLLNSPIVDSVRALFHHWPSWMNEWMRRRPVLTELLHYLFQLMSGWMRK
jgi:hypothetical protein